MRARFDLAHSRPQNVVQLFQPFLALYINKRSYLTQIKSGAYECIYVYQQNIACS